MNSTRWCICGLLLVTGCSRLPEPAVAPPDAAPRPAVELPGSPVTVAGAGRFTHSAIRPTVGPADSPATELILAEAPVTDAPTGPHLSIGLHGHPSGWSGRPVRLDGNDLTRGWAIFSTERDRKALVVAGVRFGTVVSGEPVEGEYDVSLPDGIPVRGRFRAEWLPHPAGNQQAAGVRRTALVAIRLE